MDKVNKVAKAFETLTFKINNQLNELTKNNESWRKLVNDDLEKFKKKYNELHGILLRKFLVDLEDRVRMSEITSMAVLKLQVMKFYELEKRLDPSFNKTYDEYFKQLSEDLAVIKTKVKTDMEKEDEVAMAQEETKEAN